ncbi:hypothetical protein ACNQ17_03040 [Mycoplasma sp. Sp48II]|uniref:hypothetical protein n=1 Tax=Mycoplasma sp. Sp48II TaxID=3401682 RepID=UPI003AAC2BDE
MKKKTLLKNFTLVTATASLAMLASSCNDDKKVSATSQYNKELEVLKQNIESKISENSVFVQNNLVSVLDLNQLVKQLNSMLEQKNISQAQYQALETSASTLLEQFLNNCSKVKDELVNSIKQLVAKLSTINPDIVDIQLFNQVSLATKQASQDIQENNVSALLQDKVQLTDLIGKVVQASSSNAHALVNSLINQINNALEAKKLYVSNGLVSPSSLSGLRDQLNNLLQNTNIPEQEINYQTQSVNKAIDNFNLECDNVLKSITSAVQGLVDKLNQADLGLISQDLGNQITLAIAKAKENIQSQDLTALIASQNSLNELLQLFNTSQTQNLIKAYQSLISTLNESLSENQVYIINRLVDAQPINLLITQLTNDLNQNNISQTAFNQIKQESEQALQTFVQGCESTLSNTTSSLQAKIDLFTPQILDKCKKTIKEQINLVIEQAKKDIEAKNLSAMLSELTQLDSFYSQVLQESEDSQSTINLLKQEIANFKLKITNYKTQYQSYPELVTLLENVTRLPEDGITINNLEQIKKALQKAQTNLQAWIQEAEVVNYDAEFKN